MVKSQVVKYWTKAKCIRTLCLLHKNADHPADNQEVLHKCAHDDESGQHFNCALLHC